MTRAAPPMLAIATLDLPWPPSVNAYWRHTVVNGRPRTFTTHAAKKYREATGLIWANRPALLGSIHLELTTHAPTKRRYDLDNIGKAVLDALDAAGVYGDDSQVDDLRVVRGACEGKPGRVVARVSASPAEQGSGAGLWKGDA
ncbi:MAG: RusA family crossover junction endodeoxyribonuclease [Planctomycetota bacterium]